MFEATLVQALKADSHRLKHAQRSARALLDRLKHTRHIVETRIEPYRFRHSFNKAWVRIKAWEQTRKVDEKELRDDN